jgi:hypothetical protein
MAKVSHDSNKNQLEWEGAKVDSLGGIAIFRLLLETQTTLNEYKIIGLNFRMCSPETFDFLYPSLWHGKEE